MLITKTKKHPLNSGIPCMNHKCVKCCIETRMPLSRFDIKRISDAGYKFNYFVMKRSGARYLKNVNGRCVFLNEKGCAIYSLRPEGCRLYPLISYQNAGKATLHDLCPFSNEFKFSSADIDTLNVLYREL